MENESIHTRIIFPDGDIGKNIVIEVLEEKIIKTKELRFMPCDPEECIYDNCDDTCFTLECDTSGIISTNKKGIIYKDPNIFNETISNEELPITLPNGWVISLLPKEF